MQGLSGLADWRRYRSRNGLRQKRRSTELSWHMQHPEAAATHRCKLPGLCTRPNPMHVPMTRPGPSMHAFGQAARAAPPCPAAPCPSECHTARLRPRCRSAEWPSAPGTPRLHPASRVQAKKVPFWGWVVSEREAHTYASCSCRAHKLKKQTSKTACTCSAAVGKHAAAAAA